MLTKLLLTVVVVLLVWHAFKHVQRVTEMRVRREERERAATPATARASAEDAMDLTQCRVCGTWLPSGRPKSCGRKDCPY